MLTEHPEALKPLVMSPLEHRETGITITGRDEAVVFVVLRGDVIQRISQLFSRQLPLEHIRIDRQIGEP